MADDVGDCFADGEAEDGLFCGVEMGQWRFAGEATPAAWRVLRASSISAGETLGAVAADGFADFAEGGACGLFYVGDLLGGALRVAFDEASG